MDGDCRDKNPDVNPGVVEICDGIDNDCNEGADELDAADITLWYQDQDQDGYGIDAVSKLSCTAPYLFSTEGGDCDDENPTFHPNAEEICEAGLDSNCDGYAPHDADGDGYNCDDCNNADDSIYPGAPETCNDVDDNCDGRTDNDPVDAPTWYWDKDGDGYGNPDRPEVQCEQPNTYVALNTDCDDETADAAPGLPEVCNDGLDTNCDGSPGECESLGALSETATLLAFSTSGRLGESVAALGDLNDDGYEDLAVSADYAATTKVYTVFGPFSGSIPVNLVAGLQLEGEESLGGTLANAGEQTGDSYPDILVGSCIGDYSGDVYLIDSQSFGRFQAETIQLAHISHLEADAAAGFGLWGGFDMDNDQQADVAVMAPLGAVFELSIFTGPLSGDYDFRSDAALRLVGETYLDGMGSTLVVEDVDGNGLADLVTSALGRSRDGGMAGEVYLYRDVQPGVLHGVDADVTWWGEGDSEVGAGLELVEDQDGDGEPDLWVGARDESSGTYSGSIRRMSMDAASGPVLDRTFVTVLADTCCSFLTGDLNLDGTSDLVVAQPWQVGGGLGRISLLYGPLAGTLSVSAADAWYSGLDGAGSSIALAGDTDADGNLEIVTGSPNANNSDGGVVLIEFEVW